jgi:hypothetical protein
VGALVAGWTQVLGGIVTHNGELVTHDGEPVTNDDGSGWNLLEGVVKTASVGEWAQTATWAATLSEDFEAAAGWSQEASWEAVGVQAEDVTAEATFDQVAASWLGASSQVATGSGTWEQTTEWSAEASHAESSEPPVVEPPAGVSIRPASRFVPKQPVIQGVVSFGQPPATWRMNLEVDLVTAEVETLLLAGVL